MLDKVFQFFKWAKGVYEGSKVLQTITTIVNIATVVVGVKGFLQARQMLAKGQDILANKTSAGGKIPVIYGTRRVGAQVIYMDVSNNDSRHLFVVYALSVGECDEILGRTIELDGNPITDPKRFRYGCYVGSDRNGETGYSGHRALNTVSQVGSTISAGAGGFGTSSTSRYRITFNLHHGEPTQSADPMLVASMPNWTSSHKLNGVCYIAAHYKYDKEGMFAGVPQLTVQVKGKRVYDPRDNTQTFGTPSTYKHSSNPALCFLDLISNNEYGKGLTASQLNMSTFSSAANVCDTKVDQPYFNGTAQSVTWSANSGDNFFTITGTGANDIWWQNKVDEIISIYDQNGDGVLTNTEITDIQRTNFFDTNQEFVIFINDYFSSNYSSVGGSTLLKVKRFHCNGYLDTNKNVMDNAKELLANMRGIFLYIDGQYELQIEDTGTSSFTITDDHIIADAGISVDYGNKDKKANKVIVEFFNANKKYELDTATVLHDATPEYYSDDGDEILEIKAEFPYVTDPYIAYNMAKAILTRSRKQMTIQFLGTPEMYKLNVGDIVTLNYVGTFDTSQTCRVEALELQPNGLVAVSLIEYFDVYTWETPPEEPLEELANLPSAYAVKAPTGLTFTDSSSSSTGRPILSWDAPTDYPDYEFRVNVVDSSGNQLMNRIVNTTFAELNFTPTGSNYVASVTSLNTLGTESDAETETFSVSDAPVGLGDIRADSVTANTIDVDELSAITANLGAIDAGSIDIGSGNFTVSSAGVMTATGATISGNLTATSLNVTNATVTGTLDASVITLNSEPLDNVLTYSETGGIGLLTLNEGAAIDGDFVVDGNFEATGLTPDLIVGKVTGISSDTTQADAILRSSTGSGSFKIQAGSSNTTVVSLGYDALGGTTLLGDTGAGGSTGKVRINVDGSLGMEFNESRNATFAGEVKANALELSSNTPSTTTNKLYNTSGTLYWNGSAVNTGAGDITGVTITTTGGSLTGGAAYTSGDATFTLDIGNTITGAKTFDNNVVIQGNLDVQGTTTTIDTTNLDVKDKNITLNYGTGDTSANANGAGITIQDAVSAGNDATLTWNTSNDSFNFSHPVNVTGTVTTSGNIDVNGNNIIDVNQINGVSDTGWLDFNMDTDGIYPTGNTNNITVLGSVTDHVFVGDSNANGTGGKFYWGYGVNSSDSGTFTETMELDRSGNLTVTGNVTATAFYGDGSNLTNITTTTINNNADNRIITGSGTANTLNAESGLTYNGSALSVTGTINSGAITSTGDVGFAVNSGGNAYMVIDRSASNRRGALVFSTGATDVTASPPTTATLNWALGVSDSDEVAGDQFYIRKGETSASGSALLIDGSNNATFAGTISSGAITTTGALTIDVDNEANGALRIEANQTNPDNDFYFAQEIISTLSGTTATTGDREQGGIYMDINSTATGGDTSNEHRVYGIHLDVDSTGDADLLYGAFATATATPTTGTTSAVFGGYFQGEDNGGAGTVTSVYGVQGTAVSDNADSGLSSMFGGYFKSYNVADSGSITNATAVYGELEIPSGSADIYGTSYVFRAEYDNNGTVAQTNTTYLYYGNYAGVLPTNAYGVYIVDAVDNYFAGAISSGAITSTGDISGATIEGYTFPSYPSQSGGVLTSNVDGDMAWSFNTISSYVDSGDDRVVTSTGSTGIQGEYGLTYNRTDGLKLQNYDGTGGLTSSATLTLGQSTNNSGISQLILDSQSQGSIRFKDGTTTDASISYNGAIGNILSITCGNGITFGSSNLDTTGTISSGQLNVNAGATNTTAVFESTDDKAFIRIKDDDTDTYLISKDGNFSIGGSSEDYDNFKVDISSGNTVASGNTHTFGSSSNTATIVNITATNTAGSPAEATKLVFNGYESRSQGLHFTDSGLSGERWFAGIPYSGAFNSFQIGYDQTGDQAEYAANSVFRITDGGYAGIGIGNSSPSHPLHVKHATTNVVARFESGDADVWIDLHDSNSGTYGALLGHNSTELFKVADANVATKLSLSNTGDLTIQGELDASGEVTTTGINIGTDSGDPFNAQSLIKIQDGGNAYIAIKTSTTTAGGVLVGDTDDDFRGGFIYNNSTDGLSLYSGNAVALTLDSSQNATFAGTISSGNIISTGEVRGATLRVQNTSSTTKYGLTLFGASGTNPTYGIMFTGTSGSGTHGSVTGDWATYFTMNGTANRGWIFREQTTSTNVASISNTGNATFNGTISSGAITSTLTAETGNLITFNNSNGEIGSIETQGDEMVLMSVDRGLRIRTSAVNSIIPVGTARTNLDATIDLGSSGARFKDLYLSGNITSDYITADHGILATDIWINNDQPATDNAIFSGYGIIGNRGTFYITNGGGNVQIGNGATHNSSSTATFGTTGLNMSAGKIIEMNGTTVIDSDRNLDNINSLDVTSTTSDLNKFTFTDTNSNASFTGLTIDYNASGSQAHTTDNTHTALFVDFDTSQTGGNTTDENRAYGIHVDVRGTGDTDLRYGVYSYSETQHSSGTVSANIGLYGFAVADDTGTGHTANNYGVHGLAYGYNSGTGGTTNHYGGFFKSLLTTANDKNTSTAHGVYAEVEIDNPGQAQTVTNTYGVRSIIDNDSAGNVTMTNAYLFHGDYQGTIPSGGYGLYIGDNVPNYVGGEIQSAGNITAYYSDERLKDFHGKINNPIDKVKQLNGYYFTENKKAKELGYDNDKQQVGVNAQEVQKVLPEVVDIAPISHKEDVNEEYLTVHYDKLVPLLIEAIKEQQQQIDELKARLDNDS